MNGQQLINFLSGILENQSFDPTIALQMINDARTYIEGRRPFYAFTSLNSSTSVTGGNQSTIPIPLPSDFMYYVDDEQGPIKLYNGSNQIIPIKGVPFQNQLEYQNTFGKFYVDNKNNNFYLLGQIPGPYTVYQFYIADLGNITLTTTWRGIPARFQTMLAYEAAAMQRLGVSYDDVNARNADDNAKRSDMLYQALVKWDEKQSLNSFQTVDWAQRSHSGVFRGYGTNQYGIPS